jgi:RNA polymerase sigma factor for flagellar operon FliA
MTTNTVTRQKRQIPQRKRGAAYVPPRDLPAVERDQMVVLHMRLVYHIARRIQLGAGNSVELSDLVSAGTIGLLHAIDSFDTTRNIAFSTYAMPRIRGAILDDLRRADPASRSVRRHQREIRRAEDALSNAFSRTPKHGEVAAELGVDAETLWRWKGAAADVIQVALEDAEPMHRSAPAPAAPCEDVQANIEREQRVARLREELLSLTERERTVLALYYVEELKLREIADLLGLTESRISQIRTSALADLRERMARHDV